MGGWGLPLGEDVPVGAAVLHGDAVAAVRGVVVHGVEGAVLVVVGDVLQHRRVPHKAKVTILDLRGGGGARTSEPCNFGLGQLSA